MSNSIWAFATVGFGAASTSNNFNTNNEYITLQSENQEQDRKLVARMLDVVAKSALERLHRFRPQELNNLAWGFCRLGHYGDALDELFKGIGQEIVKRHYYFKPQVRIACCGSFTLTLFDSSLNVFNFFISGYWHYAMEFRNSRILRRASIQSSSFGVNLTQI